MRIGIVGIGLMGGSFALSIRKVYSDVEIVGYDHNDQHTIEALELGIVDRVVEELIEFKNFDLIILAIPVDGIVSILKDLPSFQKRVQS